MADTEENKEEEKYYKNYPYALNTLEDIWKYDPTRLLDLGNIFQVWTSSKGLSDSKENINEEARARSNFQKMVEGKPRPFSHTMTDATRLLPDVIGALISVGAKGITKGIGKAITKGPSKKVAKKLVNEGTSDTAQAFAKSKFLFGPDKNKARKAWENSLLEKKEVMERIAGKKLSEDEVKAIKKSIKEFLPEKYNKYNLDTERYYKIYKKAFPGNSKPSKEEIVKYFTENAKETGLNAMEYRDFMRNLENMPSFDEVVHHAKIPVMTPSKSKLFDAKDVAKFGWETLKSPVTGGVVGGSVVGKLADSLVNDGTDALGSVPFPDGVIKPEYDYSGAEATPVKDIILGMLNLDFNDPARYNEGDIEALMSVLKEKGFFEKAKGLDGKEEDYYVVDTWTPRQKIGWLRERLNNKNIAELIKNFWLQSEQRKELLGE